LRTVADKIGVITRAMHTVSDFPSIFENALNKTLQSQYMVQNPTYRMIAQRRTFNDFRAHPVVRASDLPTLQAVNEGAPEHVGF
jgi:hypothetical protein